MNTLDSTLWPAILLVLFGVLFGIFPNTFTTWFIFTFLCLVGVLRAGWIWGSRK